MPKKGYKQTEEHIRKLSESHKGRLGFRKGHVPWNAGLTKETDERVRKMSESNRGKHKHTIGISNGFYGRRHTKETKEKDRLAHLGKKLSRRHRENIGKSLKDISKSEEHRKKIGEANKGKLRPEKLFPNSGMRGKYHTNKTKEKIKEKRARQIIPTKDTSIEVKIQNFLKQLGIAFFTHQYIKEIEHSFQCDILIPSMNLVIECDGDYWHKYPVGLEKDHIRTSELIAKGFKVLRLWESEIRIMELNEFREKLKHEKI